MSMITEYTKLCKSFTALLNHNIGKKFESIVLSNEPFQ